MATSNAPCISGSRAISRPFVAKDISDLAAVDRLDAIPRILELAAARSSTVLNTDGLVRDAGVSASTGARYLALLETTFFIHRIPAWWNNRTSRVAHRPKLFMVDSGLAAHLRAESSRSLLRPSGDPGPVLETFVVMELLRQLGWADERASIHHLRTKEGVEVDAVLESADGRVAGVAVKASSTVRPHDLRGLRFLAEKVGEKFVGGVVLYTGAESLSFGNKLWAVPISALWQTS